MINIVTECKQRGYSFPSLFRYRVKFCTSEQLKAREYTGTHLWRGNKKNICVYVCVCVCICILCYDGVPSGNLSTSQLKYD